MSEELKPCAHCGSRNVNDTTPPPDMSDCEEPTYYWVCPDCVCCGPIAESVELATKAWNDRHIPEGYISIESVQSAINEAASVIGDQDKGRQSDEYIKAGVRLVVGRIKSIIEAAE